MLNGEALFSYLMYRFQKYHKGKISIDGRQFSAIYADSLPKQIVGLMYRDGIGNDECMLFVFSREGSHPIWMHNMRFPIDVIWLDSTGSVIHIEEGLQPCRSLLGCKQYGGESHSKYVIEFMKGTVAKNGINMKSRMNLDNGK